MPEACRVSDTLLLRDDLTLSYVFVLLVISLPIAKSFFWGACVIQMGHASTDLLIAFIKFDARILVTFLI